MKKKSYMKPKLEKLGLLRHLTQVSKMNKAMRDKELEKKIVSAAR